MTTDESKEKIGGFAATSIWVLYLVGLLAVLYSVLSAVGTGSRWSMISLYHVLGTVQTWVFGLQSDINDVTAAGLILVVLTVASCIVLISRVSAPMRI